MTPEVIKVESEGDRGETVRRASAVLREGGLVAFPTETVYGLAACVAEESTVDRLREVKGRSADKAFTVHIGSREDLGKFVPEPEGLASRFARKAWPGPLTLVLTVDDPRSAPVVAGLNGSAVGAMYYDGTIGLRCPDNAVARDLLRAVDAPIVAASANVAGRTPPHTADEVLKGLGGRIDLLIDAGKTKYGKPSTIVRLRPGTYDIVREGVFDSRTVKRFATLRILFVCTGNTCRSPMAAGIASTLLAKRLGCEVSELASHGVEVSSAGTAGGFGGATDHAVTAMSRRAIDISAHVSTALSADLVRQADHILAMTRSHRDTICDMVPSAEERTMLLLEDEDVRDPIGGSQEAYESCAQAVEKGVRARLRKVSIL